MASAALNIRRALDSGTFAQPVRVNSTPGDARVNGEQPPRVALASRKGDPEIVVIWTAKRDIAMWKALQE